MHDDVVLRACSRTSGVYDWRHPNWTGLGQLPEGTAWYETDAWIKQDIDDIADEFRALGEINSYVIGNLIGEIDGYLEDASFGLLEQDVPESQWRKRRDAGRVYSQRGLAEIRLEEPYYVRGHRFRIRIYYSEPEEGFGGLVSLLLHAKNTDAGGENCATGSWRQAQDTRMEQAQARGDNWITRLAKG